jgi:hypothetical protein
MTIANWTPNQRETFSHKLEEIIHGPGPIDGSVGFVCITYPITDTASAVLMSNSERQMVIEVLYQVLKSLVGKGD